MPARVHAIIVARSGETASVRLRRTLDALTAQTVRPFTSTIVVLGEASHVRALPDLGASVEGIIEARTSTSFSEAVALAQPRVAAGSAVWLLAEDTRPEAETLALLQGALERSPSALIAAPKLVRPTDDREIVSLGITMTRGGRAVELAAGELDQGQHDAVDDVLGADVRGLLIRAEAPKVLRPDTALAGADEGLDLGVRARLGGARLVLVPEARIAVAPFGPAAPPRHAVARAWATRRGQLHRRLAYAPAAAVPLHWLSLLPIALWRSLAHLVAKRPAEVGPEWGAALSSMLRLGALARSRGAIRSFRKASWSDIAPLRVTRAQLKQRLDDGHGSERGAAEELNFFGGGGAWAVLAALAVNIAAFVGMLAWPAIGGGALLPMRRTLTALWSDAAWGVRDLGLGIVGPADPFAAVLAVLGTLTPAAPSYALVLLWLGALPLAVLGGWFAATRVTDRAGLRILGGVLWALSPTFLTALVQGRPAAVLLHLLLPWVFHAAVVAHRSWGAASAASLLAAAALACAPSLTPAIVLLWAVALILMLAFGKVRGAVRLFWVLIPSAALFGPLVWRRLRDGDALALLGDPGVVLGRASGAPSADRLDLAFGFPSADRAGWGIFADGALLPWAPLLLAPVALLALLAALSPRWRAGYAMLAAMLSGVATAMLVSQLFVSFAGTESVAPWPGSALSLAWLGAVGAALVTLDTMVTLVSLRVVAALTAGVAVAVCAVPALLAVPLGQAAVQNGPTSTLPALVAAQAADDADQGTLLLTPLADGSLQAQVVWGASATLGAQTTLISTATTPLGEDVATLAVDLISGRDFDAAQELTGRGIGFVLLRPGADDVDRARALREAAITSIDQRTAFVRAGKTSLGMLWRVDGEISPRPGPSDREQMAASLVIGAQLLLVLAALLLSLPTRTSRRVARSRSRIVGRMPDEPLVLPRRPIRDHNDPAPPPGVGDTAPETEEPEMAQESVTKEAEK